MLSSAINLALPPQMLSIKEKYKNNKKWAKDCMDSLEAIGRQQFYNNLRFVENYEMIRGRFIFSHYIDREDYGDMIAQLTKEFELPSHLRHYDIISQVVNTLSGEYQKRPDIFRVKAYDEYAQNNYLRTKTDLLQKWMHEELNTYIDIRLAEEGYDENKSDFASEEEQQAYLQKIDERRKELTPPEIQKYMDTKWMDISEQWGMHQLEWDKQRFNLPEKEKIEFEDMLVADRCFRHFFLTATGYDMETWNPVNTFFHKAPEVREIEKGDYVGRVFYMTLSDIINKYGFKMSEKQLLDLEKFKKDTYKTNPNYNVNYAGLQPNTLMPHMNYPDQHMVQNLLGYNPTTPKNVDLQILQALGDTEVNFNTYGLFQVTEGYWMSQRRIGRYSYINPETGELESINVDETFDIPGVEEVNSTFQLYGTSEEKPNTIVWTWVPQVWQGIKINSQFSAIKDAIYLDLKPCEFQFKGDINLYGAKLPVCGQIFNNRNADSMSLVDLMKPHQIGHNVSMNQLYEIMQREVGRFMLMDLNFIPSSKDWGGPGNYEKLMLIARQLGYAPVDASAGNARASQWNPAQMIDLDESARMLNRAKIAEFFEQQALKQVGITPQRVGNVAASETATGVTQAVNQSYAATESHFTNFSNYKRRCLTMHLEIAQYVQSHNDDIVVNYVKDDLQNGFIKLNGTDLLLSEFGVYVVNSQEVMRQLETLRQLFLENNTTGASPVDLATVITSNSVSEIKAQLASSWRQQQEQKAQEQQLAQQMQQQQIEANAEEAQKQRDHADYRDDLKLANERYIAEIKALGFSKNTDVNANSIPDVLEVQKFNAEQGKHTEDIIFRNTQEANSLLENQKKNSIELKKLQVKKDEIDQKNKNEEANRKLEREKMKSEEKIAKYRDKGKYNGKDK